MEENCQLLGLGVTGDAAEPVDVTEHLWTIFYVSTAAPVPSEHTASLPHGANYWTDRQTQAPLALHIKRSQMHENTDGSYRDLFLYFRIFLEHIRKTKNNSNINNRHRGILKAQTSHTERRRCIVDLSLFSNVT